ncbi:MAG: DUF4843 domain-containing protein [Spirosomataceae bacterium]
MKKIAQLFLFVLMAGSLTSCFENYFDLYRATVVEFDAAVRTAPAAGRTYPLLAVSNGAGIQKAQINLVGPQQATDRTIKVTVEPALSTAVAGTHYKIVNENVTIPANSSFGELQIEILRVPAQANITFNLVVAIEGSADIKPSENYKRLGWTIRL